LLVVVVLVHHRSGGGAGAGGAGGYRTGSSVSIIQVVKLMQLLLELVVL
jgi:preprotein translocase subunit SecG